MAEPANVVVGMVSDVLIPNDFVNALLSLLAQRHSVIRNRVIHVQGFAGRLDVGRHIVAKTFLENTDADYLLTLDTDMVFSPKDFDELVRSAVQSEQPAILSGLYPRLDGSFCVFDLEDQGYVPAEQGAVQAVRFYQAGAVGLGFCLIPRAILEDMQGATGSPLPWFEVGAEGPGRLADDTSFCYRATQLGYEVYVNTQVRIGHLKMVTMFPREASPELAVVEKKLLVPDA